MQESENLHFSFHNQVDNTKYKCINLHLLFIFFLLKQKYSSLE